MNKFISLDQYKRIVENNEIISDIDTEKLDNFLDSLGELIVKEVAEKVKKNKSIDESFSDNVLNEGALILTLSVVLATPAILSMMTKLVKFFSKKIKSEKGHETADKIKIFSDKIHHGIHAPFTKLGKLIGLKDEKLKMFTEVVVGIVIAALLVSSGLGLINALKHIHTAHIVSEGSLIAIKSKEIMQIITKLVKASPKT